MATKATTTKKKATTKAAPKAKVVKAPKPEKKAAVSTKARHPRARVLEAHGSKEALAKSLAPLVGRTDEDTDSIEARLKTASNAQLLRLSAVTATVKQKYGSRDGLIEAIGKAEKKSKDKDYLAKLGTISLPQLLVMATAADRRAKAATTSK